MLLRKPEACPNCGAKKVLQIYYGHPLPKAWRAIRAGKAVAGGDFVKSWAPDWHCANCRHRWYDSDDPEKQRQEAVFQKINDTQEVLPMANTPQQTTGRAPIVGAVSFALSFVAAVIIVEQFIQWNIGASNYYGDKYVATTFLCAIGGAALALVARARRERFWWIPWAAFIVGLLVLYFLIATTYPAYFSYL